MSRTTTAGHPAHGQIGYLQLPALDIGASATFYASVFGWSTETTYGSFEAPGMIGQFTTDRAPASGTGPVLWIAVEQLGAALSRTQAAGGTVASAPIRDQGERWLAEIDDPAGNRLGVFAPVRPAQPQTLISVRDVEAASAWYQRLLGLTSDHGGPDYERLLADGALVLQLHHWDAEHHHGPIGDPTGVPGNGVLVWFEVGDFDTVVERAHAMGAPIVREPHRNPPAGEGNGPAHREVWVRDLDGYTVVVASPDGEAYELDDAGS